jgi:hypothetical protein
MKQQLDINSQTQNQNENDYRTGTMAGAGQTVSAGKYTTETNG